MYDMYPWHDIASGGRRPQTPPAWGAATSPHTPRGTPLGGGAINAVQVALDRRDNGGDAAAAPGTPPAGPTRQ